MMVPADIAALAPAIARGAPVPPVEPDSRRDIGGVRDTGPAAILACLDATLVGTHVEEALRWLEVTGALGIWLPEVQALVDFHTSSPSHHKDLWTHTVEVVGRTPADRDLRWVALLHDIGKVATRAIDARGQVSFYGHERLGAELTLGIAARLRMPEARVARITFVVEHHARVNAYEAGWTDRAVRRLIRDAGEYLNDILQFSSADYTTKRRKRASRIRAQLADLRARIAHVQHTDSADPILPSGLGRALCEGLDVAPGPHIGEAITWLEAQVEAGRLLPGQEADIYVEAVRTRTD